MVLCEKNLYSAVTLKWFKIVLPVLKSTMLTFFLEILNLEGHQNRFIGSKVLNGRILPIGGVASIRVST